MNKQTVSKMLVSFRIGNASACSAIQTKLANINVPGCRITKIKIQCKLNDSICVCRVTIQQNKKNDRQNMIVPLVQCR